MRYLSENSWVLSALLSAVFAALTAVFAKIGLEGIPSDLATAVRAPVILVFAWGFAYFAGQTSKLPDITAKGWFFLIVSGLMTGLSWIFYFRALKGGAASRVVPIDRLSIVFVLLFGVIFLRERLQLHQIAGIFLILGGTLLVIRE